MKRPIARSYVDSKPSQRGERAMTDVQKSAAPAGARRAAPLVGAGLVAGGAIFFAGGGMHPKEDPPGVSLKEHLRIMFDDPAWFPAHTVLLVGMALIAVALVALVRGRSLAVVPRVQSVAKVAAVAAVLAAADMVLHLLSATEADRMDAGQSTPITDVNLVLEAITVPAFGLSIAALAVVGAATHTIGNWVVAVPGVVGGLGFALAGATFLFTDALDPLFPLAAGIGLWALAVGIWLLRKPGRD
jgi:hypothetical protein